MMLLLLLLSTVNADFFIGFTLHDTTIDVYNVFQDNCSFMYKLKQPCDNSFSFSTDDMSVIYNTDYYSVQLTNDSTTYTIFNPYVALPGINMDSHFVNTIYTKNDTNVAYVNSSYNVISIQNNLLFVILHQNDVTCMIYNVHYDDYLFIHTVSQDTISEYIALAHAITYFYQYNVLCDNVIVVMALITIFSAILILICIILICMSCNDKIENE